MRFTAPRGGKGGDLNFLPLECWNPMAMVATFAAEMDKKRISCRVSQDVLIGCFSGPEDQPMQVVSENRKALRAAARKRIESGAFEADGSIVVRAQDVRAVEAAGE